MKAVEFESMIGQNGHIALPPEVIGEIPVGEPLRVVVMWEPPTPDAAWRAAGRRAFEASYCAEDAIYERLVDETAPR